MTAKNDPLSESAALNAGAVDFIKKPINPTVVKARVKLHLSHQAREREVRQLNAELEQRVQERTQALKDALLKIETAQQANKFQIETMDFDLQTVVEACLGLAQVRAQHRELSLVVQIEPAVPLDLYGDPLRLGQILTNFLSNAVKFSEQGKVILRIRLSEMRGAQIVLRFEVEDRGVGISREDQARFLSPSSRVTRP